MTFVKRVPFPVPPYAAERTDCFGLPAFSLLTETEDKKRLRIRAVETFETVVVHVGKAEARKLFADAAKRKRGNQSGSRSLDRDRLLLGEYDALRRMPEPAFSLNQIAEIIHKKHGGTAGNSAPAIERHLRRLLKARELREAAVDAQMRSFREAHKELFGEYPRSLLGNATPDPDTK